MRLHRLHVIVPVVLAALGAPATARADTGGAEAGQAEPSRASASAGQVSVSTRPGGLVGRTKTFRGAIPAGDAGRTVTVERYDELAAQWLAIARATAGEDGAFAARWKPDRTGPLRVRARVEAAGAAAAAAAPELGITLYKAATATWYGPGFYGRKTACGQRMSRTLLGVAHKTRPCGTQISFLYRGRTITVPVVDRGPFANGAQWDLTAAASETLGFRTTGTIGALQR